MARYVTFFLVAFTALGSLVCASYFCTNRQLPMDREPEPDMSEALRHSAPIRQFTLPDGMIRMGLRIEPWGMGFIEPGSEVYILGKGPKGQFHLIAGQVRLLSVDSVDSHPFLTFAVSPEQARNLADAVEIGERLEVSLLPPT